MGDFQWKTWAKKWAYGAGAVAATAVVTYTADYLQATTFPPQYALIGAIVTVIVVNIGNAIKHLAPAKTVP